MNVIDIVVGALLTLSFISGYRDGLIRKLLVLAGMIVGLLLATKFTSPLSEAFCRMVPMSKAVASVLAFLLVFVGVVIVAKMLGKSISRENVLVKIWDKILGGIFGVIQGAIVMSLLFLFFNLFNLPPDNLKEGSFTYKRVLNFAPGLVNTFMGVFPGAKDFYKEVGKSLESYDIFK
jgi:uncharacterized membrane protein required for colicin V production